MSQAGLIPVPGGAPCDRCGTRAFRTTRTGIHRHIHCETEAWHRDQIGRRLGRQSRPTARRARETGCKGCCVCKGSK